MSEIVTVTDMVGRSGSVTVGRFEDIGDAVAGWFADAPADVSEAVARLDHVIRSGDSDAPGLCVFLGIGYAFESDA